VRNASKQPDDLGDVRRKLEELARDGRVDELIELVIELLSRVRDDNTALQARLKATLRQLYGRRSEKVPVDQLALMFDALEDDEVPQTAREAAQEAADDDEDGEVDRPVAPRHWPRRRPLPPELPREQHVIPVPPSQRTCPKCGSEKQCIGHIRSEILEFVPAQFKVIEELREKVACKSCGDGVVAAQTSKPMERGRPGPGLLAHIVVSKGQDSLPIYRQSQIYARAGVSLSPSTLGEWFSFACDVLAPVAELIRTFVLHSHVIRADDTPIRVLDRDHPKGVKRGHLWGYVGVGNLVVFDYTPTWEATGPRAFFEHFDGFVQGDGYAGFKSALGRERGDPIVADERLLGCAMHVRRKFEAAAEAGDARGAIALAYFRKIYRVEKACKKERLSPEQRKARRDAESVPVLEELYEWIHDLHRRLVPDGLLYAAVRYAINQEDKLRRCFTDGRFEIDNGEVERQLRRVALGRKNYLFAGSDRGAERLAVAYTLLGSCHMLEIDPLGYLTDVIDKIQNGWPHRRLDELLPTAYLSTSAAVNAPVDAAAG
jgi:transposase